MRAESVTRASGWTTLAVGALITILSVTAGPQIFGHIGAVIVTIAGLVLVLIALRLLIHQHERH